MVQIGLKICRHCAEVDAVDTVELIGRVWEFGCELGDLHSRRIALALSRQIKYRREEGIEGGAHLRYR